MKTIILFKLPKYVLVTIAAFVMMLSSSLCSAQADFLTSDVVPAARGSVKVTKDKYNNYIMELQITNLAEAGRLTPAKNTYVVWMVTEDDLIKNIGQVRTKTSFLFKILKAYFETKSSFKPVKIFITAEYDPTVQTPGSVVVLTTDNFDLPKK
jgi:hypothetical protein